jgi:hypothetical protein
VGPRAGLDTAVVRKKIPNPPVMFVNILKVTLGKKRAFRPFKPPTVVILISPHSSFLLLQKGQHFLNFNNPTLQ